MQFRNVIIDDVSVPLQHEIQCTVWLLVRTSKMVDLTEPNLQKLLLCYTGAVLKLLRGTLSCVDWFWRLHLLRHGKEASERQR